MCLASKSCLRLALESLYVVGNSVSEESGALRQLHFNADEGFLGIVAGKEFTLMTSSSGKVLLKSISIAIIYRTENEGPFNRVVTLEAATCYRFILLIH